MDFVSLLWLTKNEKPLRGFSFETEHSPESR